MKTTFYFLRHGSVFNPQHILYGRLPGFGLSEEGKLCMERVGKNLADAGIDVLFTSPMLRARQSAAILAEYLHLTPRVSRLLTETNDILAGMPLDVYRETFRRYVYDPEFVRRGQESISSQAKRMLQFVSSLRARYPGRILLAVSHGDPILILRATLQHVTFTYEYKINHTLRPGDYIRLSSSDGQFFWE